MSCSITPQNNRDLNQDICSSGPNLVALAWTGDELLRGQAQNRVNFDFEVDLEGQCQSPPKTIGILTKVFYIYGPNLVILADTGHELSRGQARDWHTDGHTHRQTQATTIPEGQYWPRVKTTTTASKLGITGLCESPLQWRHNERDGVPNHWCFDCLLNRLFRRRGKKHQSSASLAFVGGIHRWPGNCPHKGPITRKMFHLMTSSCHKSLMMWKAFPRHAIINVQARKTFVKLISNQKRDLMTNQEFTCFLLFFLD